METAITAVMIIAAAGAIYKLAKSNHAYIDKTIENRRKSRDAQEDN